MKTDIREEMSNLTINAIALAVISFAIVTTASGQIVDETGVTTDRLLNAFVDAAMTNEMQIFGGYFCKFDIA